MNNKLFKLAVLGAVAGAANVGIAANEMSDALPDAKAGECYAKVVIPAQYRTETSTVVVKEASEELTVIPAKYETAEERFLVSEASTELEVVPATYATETETYEVSPASTRWVMGSAGSSIGADSALVAMARANGAAVDSAAPGQCFSEHFSPETYKNVSEQVLVSEASEEIKLIPAQYELVEQRILVEPASRKLLEVPAVFGTEQQRVMVEDAKTEWKKGRGAVEKIDNGTGEIMCLIETPPVYKMIDKRVLKTPASTRVVEQPARYETIRVRKLVADAKETRVSIPAEYKTVTKRMLESDGSHTWKATGASGNAGKPTGNVICLQETVAKVASITRKVVKTPASVKRVEVPATYDTKSVRRMVEEPREVRTAIPAVTDTVTRRVKVTDERLAWNSVLCETNMSVDLIQKIQRALAAAGHNPGKIDGVLGAGTMDAVDSYQRSEGLSTGSLTLDTLKKLGINR